MDVVTQWRLLTGAARPYLKRKVQEALSRPGAVRRAMKSLPTSPDACGAPRSGLMPLPGDAWQRQYLDDAAAFARRVKRGDIRAYGVTEFWLHQDEPESLDPRGVLEVARMHQWPAYALAALRAQKQGDAEEARGWYHAYMDEVHRFGLHHQPFASPLWSVAMDSAIRVVNLLTAFDWFQQLDLVDPSAGPTISAAAQDHVIVIEAKLETAGGMATSHLLGDLMGLIAVDVYAGRHPERLGWFAHEVQTQILHDGMSFEASTGYHRQVVDILVPTLTMLRHGGIDVPDVVPERTRKAVEDLRLLEHAGMPLIGDNDDGMVYKLTGFTANTAFLHELHPVDVARSPLHHFPDFGLSLYERPAYTLSARCGYIGQHGKGGHAHNDQNAITLRIQDVDLIVDPGSVWYGADPAQRNRDRSVRSHATVRLDQSEQNGIPKGGGSALWWMLPEIDTRITEASVDAWVGEVIYGDGTHRRAITFEIDRIDVVDTIPEGATGEIRFPTAPGTVIAVQGTSATLTRRGVSCTISWDDTCSPRIANDEVRVAERFGFAEPADVLILDMRESKSAWCLVPSA